MSRRRFSQEERDLIVARRKAGSTFASIARHLRSSDQSVWYSYQRHVTGHAKPRIWGGNSNYMDREDDAVVFAKLPRYDTRSLTGAFFGDPLPDRSALAQRRLVPA